MSPALRMADMQTTYERSIESDYKARIEQLLAPIVGIENVNSDVDVMMDFSEFETTSEVYDEAGRGPISRSEVVSIDRKAGGSAVGGVPGAQSNIAPADTTVVNGIPEADQIAAPSLPSEPTSERTTRNYELDRSIKYSRNAVGTITRLSVAVVINQKILDGGTEGEAGALPAINTEQLSDLVKSSIGFDEARGDQVLVMGSPFMELAQIEEIPTPWYENPSLQSIAQMLGAVIIVALALLFVVRPALTSALAKGSRNSAGATDQALANAAATGQALQQYGYDERVGLVRQVANSDSAKVANAIREMVRS
jgi:flagellar M-ring protein FliF